MKRILAMLLAVVMVAGMIPLASAEAKWSEQTTADGWILITNEGGATLGYDPNSGVTILEVDGYAFKDLNKNGTLDVYEDWRESYEDRAADLVSQMSIQQMSGLRLNGAVGSLSTDIPTMNDMDGNPMLSQIMEDGKRYFIMYPVAFGSALTDVVPTSNALQMTAEASELGIPMMLNCDPTTTMTGTVTSLALGATFSPEKVAELSQNVAKLYRATGITMALSPQVDLETDPRSQSVNTFTEDPALAADLTDAMISAYQSTFDEDGNDLGWGTDSLSVQFKHFFANLANEGGRNYHDFTGKYTVTDEEQIETQLVPFVNGGFTLSGATGSVSAVMVTYTVPMDADGDSYGDEAVGGAFNDFVMGKLEEYNFDGMVSTDSLIWDTLDLGYMVMKQTAYNVDDWTMDEKIVTMFALGVDQIMGSNNVADVMSAYDAFIDEYSEEEANENWADAAYDCVLPIFRVGNFENPYQDTAVSKAVFSTYTPDATNELAQETIVMLKNNGVIAESNGTKAKVYIANTDLSISKKTLKNYIDVVENPADADFAVVFVNSPACINTGYNEETGEWVPISLQYRPYTADGDAVAEDSLTADVEVVMVETPYGPTASKNYVNRGYYDATNTVSNEADLDLILATAELGIPVVVCVNASGSFCVDEFEAAADAILVGYGVDLSNYLPLIAGTKEPSALLPLQMPANMEAVEAQASGTPRDMACYVDANGNTYDFAFGMNWSGVISDERTATYGVAVQVGLN